MGALQNGILQQFDSTTEWYVLEHRKSNEFTKANLLLRNDCQIMVEHFSCLFSLHYKFLHFNKNNTTTVYEHIKKKKPHCPTLKELLQQRMTLVLFASHEQSVARNLKEAAVNSE